MLLRTDKEFAYQKKRIKRYVFFYTELNEREKKMFVKFILTFLLLKLNQCEKIDLKTGVHLFVDNHYIKNSSGLEFRNGLIAKELDSPIVHPEYPWEMMVHFYTSFLQVPADLSVTGKPMYLIYYACGPADAVLFNSTVSVCVANSSDGNHWEKPLLPYYPHKSSQLTNIVFVTDVFEYLGSVFIDHRSGIPSSEKFKMSYESTPKRFVYVGKSSNGFNWTAGDKPANPTAGLSDTQTTMFYSNENGGQYVLFARKNQGVPNSTLNCPGSWAPYRHVVVTVSSGDIYGPWTNETEAFILGSPDPVQCFDNYNPAALYYKNIYFLFPSAYFHWTPTDSGAPIPRAAENDGVMDIRLVVSRNALSPFQFVTRDTFISRGIGSIDPITKLLNGTGSDRDAGFVFSSSNGLLDPDHLEPSVTDENPSAWMYHVYWGSQTTHAGGGAYLGSYWPGAYSGIFKARLRREGYVALSTISSNPTGFGTFVTEVFKLPSDENRQLQLKLNAEISTAGFLSVQFEYGATGEPIEGYSFDNCRQLHGNGVRQLVQYIRGNETYTADLTPLLKYENGVQIRFQMAHTKLYSWLLSYV